MHFLSKDSKKINIIIQKTNNFYKQNDRFL